MHSSKMSIAMGMLVLGLLCAVPTAVAVKRSRRNCSTDCGGRDSEIRYPFGIGPECSMPGFNLTCESGSDNTSYLLVGNPGVTVDRIGRFDSFSFIYGLTIAYSVKVRDYYSVHWTAPGRPFAISGSSNMSLVVVGCGVEASLFIGESDVEVGKCSVACVEDEIMERLPRGLCVGIGCCLIDIAVNLRAFTLNISRTGHASRLYEQVNAFITDNSYFSKLSDFESNLKHPEPAKLSWSIPYQPNCTRAMEDRANYACVSNHSYCLESPIGGYVCNCVEGFYGNPYIHHGCKADQVYSDNSEVPVYDTMQPNANCPTSCGNVGLAFPFGSKVGCFARLQLFLLCNPVRAPPILQMPDGSVVTGISIEEGILRVLNSSNQSGFWPELAPSLYATSGEWAVVKWAVDNMTCKDAMVLKEGYRCFSHSDCLDVTDERTLNHVGYRCKCSPGFAGNPYIKDGCTDINECMKPEKYICNGICQNTFGSYTCTGCPRGTDFNHVTGKCKPYTIILGVSVGLSSGGGILFLGAVFAVLTRRWKRSVQKRLRRRYFHNNKGILLEQNLSNYFLWAIEEKPLEEIVDEQILGEASEEAIAGTARLAQECLSLTRGERPTMKDVEMRLQMLRARSAAAPSARRGEEMIHARSEAVKVNGIIGAVAVTAGHHGTRQYSLEQEFMSSARVPR